MSNTHPQKAANHDQPNNTDTFKVCYFHLSKKIDVICNKTVAGGRVSSLVVTCLHTHELVGGSQDRGWRACVILGCHVTWLHAHELVGGRPWLGNRSPRRPVSDCVRCARSSNRALGPPGETAGAPPSPPSGSAKARWERCSTAHPSKRTGKCMQAHTCAHCENMAEW